MCYLLVNYVDNNNDIIIIIIIVIIIIIIIIININTLKVKHYLPK